MNTLNLVPVLPKAQDGVSIRCARSVLFAEQHVLRLAQLVGSAYEWAHHRPWALATGVTADKIGRLATWRDSPDFTPTERLVLAATEAVHEMAVTDELFSSLEAELGPAGAMELIVVISQYEAVARIIQALGVEVEADHQHHLIDWAPSLSPGMPSYSES